MTTNLTLVWLLPSVDALMVNQLARCSELLWAILAMVGLVTKMHLLMRYKIIGVLERLLAVRALMRALFRVCPAMTIHLTACCKGSCADATFVGLFTRMRPFMNLHVSDANESLRAKSALQGLVITMCTFVDAKRAPRAIHVSTFLTHERSLTRV